MLILALLAARSTSTSATPAWSSLVLMNRLRRMSSCSHLAYCFCSYHLEFQLLMMPSRNPTGCVFCPMLVRLCHGYRDVRRAFVDAGGAPHGARHPPLERG